MLPSLKRLTTVQANLQRGIAAARRDLFALIDTPGERDAGTRRTRQRCARRDRIPRRAACRYADSAPPALRGIDLRCPRGTVTALVGRSGSGKSTLASLMPRFYEPSAGAGAARRPAARRLHARQPAPADRLGRPDRRAVRRHASRATSPTARLAGAERGRIVAAADAANAMEFIRAAAAGHRQPRRRGRRAALRRPAPAHRDRARDCSRTRRS